MKDNQALTIEQMQKLQNLGVDTSKASMIWDWQPGSDCYELLVYEGSEFYYDEKSINTFTLQDILEFIPREIDHYKLMIVNYGCYPDLSMWELGYFRHSVYDESASLMSFTNSSLLDNAYQMLLWCIRNGHLKTVGNAIQN